jgi:ATP-dependent Clp protease ATP-binding subunit ClpC
MAEEGRIDPIIGRDKEIERVSQILQEERKIIQFLLSVGKSAIAEGLALRI